MMNLISVMWVTIYLRTTPVLQTTFLGKVYCVSNFEKLPWLYSCTRITACQNESNSAENNEVGLTCSGTYLVEWRALFFLVWCFLMTIFFFPSQFLTVSWQEARSEMDGGLVSQLPALTPVTSICGIFWEITLAKIFPKYPCQLSWMNLWIPCNIFVKSWSTVNSWTRLLKQMILMSAW